MLAKVNTAALEAVLDATRDLIKIRQGLGLETVTYVLGEEDPVELEVCVEMLQSDMETAQATK